MSNISVTNSTYGSGGIDTRDTLDGATQATFQQMNGVASAAVAIETILGDGPTLKGNKADLATRLATSLDADGNIVSQAEDSRTNTVADGATFTVLTTSTPAAGIGTRTLLQAESQDEVPSDVGASGAYFTDVNTGTEDSRWAVWLRIAGAALSVAYEWATTTAFKAIFTHANSADRTYTLPNFDGTLATLAGSENLTNKRITSSVLGIQDRNVNIATLTSATETTLYTYSVPGNTLSTDRSLRVTFLAQAGRTTGGTTVTIRLKYGATTFATFAITGTNNSSPIEIVAMLMAKNSASVQRSYASAKVGPDGGTTGTGGTASVDACSNSLAIDSTSSQNLVITGQWDSGIGDQNMPVYGVFTELLGS